MPELSYHELHIADSYYLSAPRSVSPKRRSGFNPPTPKPCPRCYRPLVAGMECDHGAAKREARA